VRPEALGHPRISAWLSAARATPDRTAVFVDFDGTLAPLVDDPARALPAEGALPALEALSGRIGLLAVVSGRPASYLQQRLGGTGTCELVGLYGMERVRPGSDGVEADPAAERWREAVDGAALRLEALVPSGVGVENKGLAVTVHYRTSPSEAEVVERLAAEAAASRGLAAHPGKMSVELRPPVEVDKGTVLAARAAGFSAVLFAGDDTGDLPAFAVLARLRSQGVVTLAIASGGAETPREVTEAADVVVEGPGEVVELISALAAALAT
jgi:trehalose 6-phosphate phosphatase